MSVDDHYIFSPQVDLEELIEEKKSPIPVPACLQTEWTVEQLVERVSFLMGR